MKDAKVCKISERIQHLMPAFIKNYKHGDWRKNKNWTKMKKKSDRERDGVLWVWVHAGFRFICACCSRFVCLASLPFEPTVNVCDCVCVCVRCNDRLKPWKKKNKISFNEHALPYAVLLLLFASVHWSRDLLWIISHVQIFKSNQTTTTMKHPKNKTKKNMWNEWKKIDMNDVHKVCGRGTGKDINTQNYENG